MTKGALSPERVEERMSLKELEELREEGFTDEENKELRGRDVAHTIRTVMANHYRAAAKEANHILECVFDGFVLSSIQNIRYFLLKVESFR